MWTHVTHATDSSMSHVCPHTIACIVLCICVYSIHAYTFIFMQSFCGGLNVQLGEQSSTVELHLVEEGKNSHQSLRFSLEVSN